MPYGTFQNLEATKPQRWMTLDAWSEEGMKVTKGSKCKLKSPDGLALFNEEQVEEFEDPMDAMMREESFY